MNTAVEENSFTFSNHPEKSTIIEQHPGNKGDPRPKANPMWVKHNRPTLELPENDSPRYLPSHQQLSSGVMNNVDLIDHAFSTPTSGTPLTSGFYSSGSETPLLGLANLSSVTHRDTHLDSVCQIFDKISLEKRQGKLSQTPPPEFRGKVHGIHKKVSFDVQSILSPLSAKPFDRSRTVHEEFAPNKPSVWENSLDNEEEIIERVRIPHDQERLFNHEYRETVMHKKMSAVPHSRNSSIKAAPHLTSPHSATVPYFGRSFQASFKAPSQLPPKQMYPSILTTQKTCRKTILIEQHNDHEFSDVGYARLQEYESTPLVLRSPLHDSVENCKSMANQFPDGQESSPRQAADYQENIIRRDNRGHSMRSSPKTSTPLTCFACRGVGHKATQCPTHPRPVVATSSTDVIVNCAIHGKPRTSKNMFFNNEIGLWQCFSETECKSMVN